MLLHKEGLEVYGDWGHLIPFHHLDLILQHPGVLLLLLPGLDFLGHLVLQPLCRFIDKDGTYLCRLPNANTLELLERGSWKMSSGWVPPVVSAVKEYGQAAGCVAPSYIRMCVRCLVALFMLQVAWQAFCTWAAERPKQSRPWKLLRLYWSESAADVKYCYFEFHLCLFYQAYLDLCDQLVVQQILPVLLLRLAIANPFKTKQESQGALEIPDEPPCYILQAFLTCLV